MRSFRGAMHARGRREDCEPAVLHSRGDRGAPAPSIEIDQRYLQNTMEQLVLALVAHLALVTIVAPESIRAVAVLVMLFVIGRITFWFGYHRSGPARAFGFGTPSIPPSRYTRSCSSECRSRGASLKVTAGDPSSRASARRPARPSCPRARDFHASPGGIPGSRRRCTSWRGTDRSCRRARAG